MSDRGNAPGASAPSDASETREFEIRGRCPDAWHPMATGDGLLVRLRPALGRLDRSQVEGLCAAVRRHGNGLLDMTRRANLQIRGVTEAAYAPLRRCLVDLGLVQEDARREERGAILVAPRWQEGDATVRIARELADRREELPELPGKVGFVVDAGAACELLDDPGDFRIERGLDGDLIARAQGRAFGVELEPGREVDALIALAQWFVASGGAQAGRMARHEAPLPHWARGDVLPADPTVPLAPGPLVLGTTRAAAWGLAFGQISVASLERLFTDPAAKALRLTPWRLALVEGARFAPVEGLIADPADPLRAVEACPGAPYCSQASVEVRDLARHLAPVCREGLLLSGCAKHCAARPDAVRPTLTGRQGRYDLSGEGIARPGLTRAEVLAHFGVS